MNPLIILGSLVVLLGCCLFLGSALVRGLRSFALGIGLFSLSFVLFCLLAGWITLLIDRQSSRIGWMSGRFGSLVDMVVRWLVLLGPATVLLLYKRAVGKIPFGAFRWCVGIVGLLVGFLLGFAVSAIVAMANHAGSMTIVAIGSVGGGVAGTGLSWFCESRAREFLDTQPMSWKEVVHSDVSVGEGEVDVGSSD